MSKKTSRFAIIPTLVLALSLVGLPARADSGQLAGVVQARGGDPLAGVTVYAADPQDGTLYPSAPSAEDGRFEIQGLPAGRFELGVAEDDRLYLVGMPVDLAPAQSRDLLINVQPGQPSGGTAPGGSPTARGSVWNNPLTAALIVVGSALVIGLLVEAATDDEDTASPM